MTGVPPAKCQKLMLEAPVGGRTSVEVTMVEGQPDCPYSNAEAAIACEKKIGFRTIRGPWRFEFEARPQMVGLRHHHLTWAQLAGLRSEGPGAAVRWGPPEGIMRNQRQSR
jgi:hypothetical protein